MNDRRVYTSQVKPGDHGGLEKATDAGYSQGRVWAFPDGDVWLEFYTGFVGVTTVGTAAFMRRLGEHLIAAADASEKGQAAEREREQAKKDLAREQAPMAYGVSDMDREDVKRAAATEATKATCIATLLSGGLCGAVTEDMADRCCMHAGTVF